MHGMFNLPAAMIVLLVTALSGDRHPQSANANTVLVVIKSLVLLIFMVAGAAT